MQYIARRARQERGAAEAAQCERSRRIHIDLANRYEEILRAYGVDASRAA